MGSTGKYRPASAGAAIFDESGRICLIRRADNRHWALPGGAIEEDETAAAAAVREVKEETGLEVKILRLVGVYPMLPGHIVRVRDAVLGRQMLYR